MTHRLDQLEAGGLVSRAADLADGRAVRVTLTAAGREAVDAALSALLARERRLLGSLSRDDSDTLARLLRSLLEPFDGEGAAAGTGSPPG